MDDKSECLKTNEEIIEELTKDLESSCIKENDNYTTSNDNIQESKNGNLSNVCNERIKRNSDDDDDNWETKCKGDANHEKDNMDEEILKEREQNLSEEEKETLKAEAEKYKNEGNDLFKREEYLEAISVYTQGIQTCPLAYSKERSVLYANRAAAKLKCLDRESAISDCTKAIELNPSYVKVYARRARLYEETEKLDEALEDYKKILTFDPGHTEANYAVRRLPPLIHERNEKLKTEMLGKLKDLGNMVLKPFGLSTNNFELQKDPNSGGYSVKFHQNPR
ncbi:tetratricopeptide repeat protein 1 [Apis laboriosa]|uniref:tetratricopeptide repeat protein 1 n=1 Tax=Apis laboriosa TaxID=183418 RepID=UPI001CC6CF5F|nr:tetratricopeptide repeat protein 1 [Apis laboriosa]